MIPRLGRRAHAPLPVEGAPESRVVGKRAPGAPPPHEGYAAVVPGTGAPGKGAGAPVPGTTAPLVAAAAAASELSMRALFGDAGLAPWSPAEGVAASGGAALAQRLGAVLQAHLASVNYNSMGPGLKLADHIQKVGQDAPPDEVLRTFAPVSVDDVRDCGGATCVGLARDLAQKLVAEGVPAYTCAVELPEALRQGSPLPYGHVAVVVRFQNPDDAKDRGFVLLDPGLWWPVPVVVTDQTPGLTGDTPGPEPVRMQPWPSSTPWTFTVGDEGAQDGGRALGRVIRCTVEGEHGGTSRFFVDQVWRNPDPYLERAAALSNRPRIVARSRAGDVLACVAVLSATGKPLVMVEANGQRVRLPIAPWADVEAALTEPLARLLLPNAGTDARARLIDMVKRTVEAVPLIGPLRRKVVPEKP